MKKRSGLLATATLAVGLALSIVPAVAGASTAFSRSGGPAPTWQAPGSRPATDLSLVHGIPGLDVDIYVIKNFTSYKELPDVHFGTGADLTTAFPGWVTPGLYTVDVVATGTSPFKPLLIKSFFLGYGQSKTVAAYVTATPAGGAGQPTLGVFTNDVSGTGGMSRVTVRHLAVAPTVGVYADGSVAITPSFSNGQTATAVVPPSTYGVTVTAPDMPGTVLDNVGDVALAANTNTLAFAIGSYPTTFTVVVLAIPTA
ncbi:MAG: hypothetical protein ABSB68_02945 [Acidimicrobiales bacterium]|jgi:hypothetical protein